MPDSTQPSSTSDTIPITSPNHNRLHAVDALRGFALIGVGLVHFIEQFMAGAPPESLSNVALATLPDKIIVGLVQFFLAGKFYAIFSFLFGLSFFIQIDKPLQNNQPFAGRFAWRLALLFGFGFIHHLFYRGDILVLYSVLGFSLLLLYKLPTKTLLLMAAALFFGLGRFISFAIAGESLQVDTNPNGEQNLSYFTTLKQGTLLDVFASNITLGYENLIQFQFGLFGRGYITLGLFILGMCLGRLGVFHNLPQAKPVIKKVLWWALGGSFFFLAAMAACFVKIGEPTFTTWLEAIAVTFYDLANLSLATFLSCCFLLFGLRSNSKKTFRYLAPYGRMALTNYMVQGIIGTAILYGWGLGFIGEWPNRILLLVGVTIITLQLIASSMWMRYFHFGPLEWLWRSLTLRKRVALVKTARN